MSIFLKLSIEEVTPVDRNEVLLQNIAFEIDKPGIIWIQGANGAGKSVLSSVLSGKAFFKGSGLRVDGKIKLKTPEGEIAIADNEHSIRDYAQHVTFLPQKLGTSFLAIHHQDDICFGLEGRFPNFPGRTDKKKDKFAIDKLDNILNRLNAWAHLTRKLGESSYGETRRMELACVLSPIPYACLVILDEPFLGLDTHHRKELKEILNTLSCSEETIWVITSRESPEVFGIKPDKIVNLTLKKIAKNAFLTLSKIVARRFARNPMKKLKPIKLKDIMIRRYAAIESMVELRYFFAQPGVITCLKGDNGSGKSSVAKVLAGLISTSKSKRITVALSIEGEYYEGGISVAPNKRVKMSLQNPFKSFIYQTIKRDLEKPQSPSDAALDLPSNSLKLLDEGWGKIDRKPATFSFGQLRFLQLLLFSVSSEVIIIDEPFLGIHQSLHSIMQSTLHSIANSGRIVIATCQSDQIYFGEDVAYTLTTLR